MTPTELAQASELRHRGDNLTPREVARKAVSSLNDMDVRLLASDMLEDVIVQLRRAAVREVEKRATEERQTQALERVRRLQEAVDAAELPIETAIREVEEVNRLYGGYHSVYETVTATVDGVTATQIVGHRGSYGSASARSQALKKAHRKAEDTARRQRARVEAGFDAVSNGLAADMWRFLELYRDEVRLELTKELLDARFAAGSGREVTWGEATVADHEGRIAMQLQHAAGTLEDVERHRAAVTMLRESGAPCLRTLAEAARAA